MNSRTLIILILLVLSMAAGAGIQAGLRWLSPPPMQATERFERHLKTCPKCSQNSPWIAMCGEGCDLFIAALQEQKDAETASDDQ